MEKVTETRLEAQGRIQHYEKKLQENNAKIAQESQAAEVLQQEFVVSTSAP
jgi:hypothetical protein